MVVPHWNGSGTPGCDLQAKGAIVGLTMASTRHDVAKAILEGLTFELLINLRQMEQCGIGVQELAGVGGGAKSPIWLQLKADILNRPVRTLRCRESACLGAALLAGTAVGVYDSLDEGVRQTVAYERSSCPMPRAPRAIKSALPLTGSFTRLCVRSIRSYEPPASASAQPALG